MSIHVPLEKVLAQLSKGCVRITFGELRSCAREVFSDDPCRDHTPVVLPLGEIIARLNPAIIQRRRTQKLVTVPEDISSPFDKDGQGLVFAEAPAPVNRLRQKPPPPSGPGSVTLPPIHSPVSSTPVDLNGRSSLTSAPTPLPPSLSAAPIANIAGHARPVYRNGRGAKQPAGESKPVQPEAPVEPAAAATSPNADVAAPTGLIPMPLANSNKPTAAEQAVSPVEQPIVTGLAALAEQWPEPVRKEIVEGGLVDAKVALPHDLLAQALKKGRIVFPWKDLKSWVTPQPAQPLPPQNEQLVLELPLKVVAPLFLARQQDKTNGQQKVVIDEDIPNLFFGFPQPETGVPVASATAKPEDTNFYVWDDVAESARVDESDIKKSPTPGTRFVSKYATPNEVVSRAASFDGVAGALIALPDGLMVASRLPADVNGDTLAAFLPQIFGKVSQCTRELRMGDLNNLNFTVGNVPWKIFRVNAIFFAAFGRSGAPLPTAQLAALAAELDHRPRE